jgi:Activator of Hsp90 ATPase homolog 1-like protein
VDGAYDIYFSPEAKPGERGAEGMRILGLEPMRRFAFTWNGPQTIPDVRSQRMMVILEFEKKGADRTLFRFTHLGWGEGASWDEAYDYFDHAWNEVVLPRFRYAMEVEPVNWEKTPKLPPVASTLKVSLARP